MKQNPGTGQYETNPNNASLQEKSLKLPATFAWSLITPQKKKGII